MDRVHEKLKSEEQSQKDLHKVYNLIMVFFLWSISDETDQN